MTSILRDLFPCIAKELDQLEEDAKVYKLVGPVLIAQELGEAKSTVNTRLEFINKELTNARGAVEKLEKTQQDKRMALLSEQQKFQAAVQRSAGALSAR